MIVEAFQRLKTNLELSETFHVRIQQHHQAVRSAIEKNAGIANTKLIGSLQRKTRIQPKREGEFDIDILVVLGSFHGWLPPGATGGVSPADAMQTVHEAVNDSDRYGAMGPQQDQPTVSFAYGDGVKVELVPAYLDEIGSSCDGTQHVPKGRAYWVPKDGKWVLADYDHDASYMVNANDNSGGYLIPTIKMLKAIKREHFPSMSSFHLELIAAELIPAIIAVRKTDSLPISYQILITEFFRYSREYLFRKISTPGSHTPDCVLDSTVHGIFFNRFNEINAICEVIGHKSDSEKMKTWRLLFGEPFPTQI